MKVSLKQLKKASVETVSGTVLGHVVDIHIDTNAQAVQSYEVKGSLLAGKHYLIAPAQIVRFEEDTIIVDDAVMGDVQSSSVLSPPLSPETGGAALAQDLP